MTITLAGGQQLDAVVCPVCHARLYPPAVLEMHLDKHELICAFLRGEMKKLKKTFGMMRDLDKVKF